MRFIFTYLVIFGYKQRIFEKKMQTTHKFEILNLAIKLLVLNYGKYFRSYFLLFIYFEKEMIIKNKVKKKNFPIFRMKTCVKKE